MLNRFHTSILTFLGVLAFCVPMSVHAAGPQMLHLHLDEGFLGHPVKLDLFGGAVRVGWDTGGLVKSGDIEVQLVDGVLTVTPASTDMFAPKGLAVSLAATPSKDLYQHNAVAALNATGTWDALDSTEASGFVTTKTSSGSFKIALSKRGMRSGTASWYAYKHCKCAASPDFPKGTKLLVRRADDPSKSVVVTVNDYGPDRRIFPDRVIDLDRVAFSAIGNPRGGVMRVTVEPYVPAPTKIPTSS